MLGVKAKIAHMVLGGECCKAARVQVYMLALIFGVAATVHVVRENVNAWPRL